MTMKTRCLTAVLLLAATGIDAREASHLPAPTGQRACYDLRGSAIACTGRGAVLGGQDAFHTGEPLRYSDNHDGSVRDLNTGLDWQKEPGPKLNWNEARAGAAAFRAGGQADWRLPSIKELYSLMDFSGSTPVPGRQGKPFIDSVFGFRYGNPAAGERLIDAQFWSATEYTGRTMGRDASVFGVNFADGRIKAYPKMLPGRGENRMFVRYVRGSPEYGRNDFVNNRDGTVTDRATGLMWMQADSGLLKAGPFGDGRMDWAQALTWAADLKHAGHRDWRLPNAKELQSIVDYARSPLATGTAAIDPVFKSSTVTDETGRPGFGFYWTSTTHLDGPRGGSAAVYVAFGEALGFMRPPWSAAQPVLLDVHGAGAQRSDPKLGNPADYPQGMGPQGDVRRIYHLVRLVRDAGRAPSREQRQ